MREETPAMKVRRRRVAACAAGAVAAALIAGGYAVLHGGGTPRSPAVTSSQSAAVARARGGSRPTPAARDAVAARIPLAVPNSAPARKAVTLTSCIAAGAGGHASGTVTAPGRSAATYTITVFFTTPRATVVDYGTAKVHAVPGKATPGRSAGTSPRRKACEACCGASSPANQPPTAGSGQRA